jgi:hypothetical protein
MINSLPNGKNFGQFKLKSIFWFKIRIKNKITNQKKIMTKIAIFTVHKAASMLLHKINLKCCEMNRLMYYSPNGRDHSYQLEPLAFPESKLESESMFKGILKGFIGPIRVPLDINLDECLVNLQLRDPRDGLNSMFFSFTKIHPDFPEEIRLAWLEKGIDQCIIEWSDDYLNRYQKYIDNFIGHPNVNFLKYENMVFDFETWLHSYIKVFELSSEQISELEVYLADEVNPATANPKTHKRKILPGDYKNNLKPETIDFLNQKFSSVLSQLDYEL